MNKGYKTALSLLAMGVASVLVVENELKLMILSCVFFGSAVSVGIISYLDSGSKH